MINQRLRSTVIVTLKDGSSFRGVLFDWDSEAFVLRDVALLEAGADRPAPVDGELVVMVADVAYMQIP